MTDLCDLERKAFEFALVKHQGQVRFDGSPYIEHPKRVAENVSKFKASKNKSILVAAAFLHDTLEDTDTTFEELVSVFGANVAYLVKEVTTDEEMKKRLGKAAYLKLKMCSMSSYGLVIKLSDRFDNVCDLENASPSFRIKYVSETLEILDYVLLNRNCSKSHLFIMNFINDAIKDLIDRYDELKCDNVILGLSKERA